MSNFPIDNPYNPNTIEQAEKFPLDEIIKRAIRAEIARARVMMPAKIIKINGPQNVDVQPLFKTRYIDGEIKDLPPIQQVPVSMIMGADYSIKVPIAVGDIGHIQFLDRSIDNWIASSGEIVDPNDTRCHDISDAVFVPALLPAPLQSKDSSTDMAFTNGKGVLKIQKTGKFIFTNGKNELIDILSKITNQLETLSDTLAKDTVNTIFGPSPLNSLAVYAQIKTDVEGLLSKLDSLKGS